MAKITAMRLTLNALVGFGALSAMVRRLAYARIGRPLPLDGVARRTTRRAVATGAAVGAAAKYA